MMRVIRCIIPDMYEKFHRIREHIKLTWQTTTSTPTTNSENNNFNNDNNDNNNDDNNNDDDDDLVSE